MTVYIDIIFLENLFMNYIILFATSVILKNNSKIIRILLSSIVGSVYAIITYLSILNVFSNFILKIILSIVMIQIAFKPETVKKLIKQLIIFYLTSFTFGGVAFALLYFINENTIIFKDGALISVYPIKIILFGGIIGFLIITTAFKNIKVRLSKKDIMCNIRIDIENKQIWMKAVIDTGNFLKDPITKRPVIVAEANKLRNILPNELLDNLQNIIEGKQFNIEEYKRKIRIIPFSSLGKQNGMIVGIKVDGVQVQLDEPIYVENVILGLYTGVLSKNSLYSALIGLDIIDNKGGMRKDEFYGAVKG